MKYSILRLPWATALLIAILLSSSAAFAENENENQDGVNVAFDRLAVEFSGDTLVIDYAVDPESWEEVQELEPQMEVHFPTEPRTEDPDFELLERFTLQQAGEHSIILSEEHLAVTEVELSLQSDIEEMGAIETPREVAQALRMTIRPEMIKNQAVERPAPEKRPALRAPLDPPPPVDPDRRIVRPYVASPLGPPITPIDPRPLEPRERVSDRPTYFDGASEARQRRYESIRDRTRAPSRQEGATDRLQRRHDSIRDRSRTPSRQEGATDRIQRRHESIGGSSSGDSD